MGWPASDIFPGVSKLPTHIDSIREDGDIRKRIPAPWLAGETERNGIFFSLARVLDMGAEGTSDEDGSKYLVSPSFKERLEGLSPWSLVKEKSPWLRLPLWLLTKGGKGMVILVPMSGSGESGGPRSV